MANRRLRVLYLGNAYPPGMTGTGFVTARSFLTPHINETVLTKEIGRLADVSSVGLLPGTAWERTKQPKDDSPGLDNELVLWDRNPALWHRWISSRKLRSYYLDKVQRGEMPDILFVRNLQHVFNYFVKWLLTQPKRPIIVLLFGDSGGIGLKIPAWRRFRYRFKPMLMMEDEALPLYEAGVVSGLNAGRFFESRGIPWIWTPSCFHCDYEPPPPDPKQKGPIRFGYFGALTERSAILTLAKVFIDSHLPGTLHICGHGDKSEELTEISRTNPKVQFDGFLPKQSDCLPWAQKMDVLVNLRLPYWGFDNSAPSKVFEYGVAGKAILTTRTSGMDEVLGTEGLYVETENFEESLRQKLIEISAMDRAELQRRAAIIHEKIIKNYSPQAMAQRIVEFFHKLVEQPSLLASQRPLVDPNFRPVSKGS